MAKNIFELADGSIAHNFKELAVLLGVEKVTREDLEPGGQYADMVTVKDSTDTSNSVENTEKETDSNVESNTEGSSENTNTENDKKEEDKQEDVDKTKIYTTVNPEDVETTPEEVMKLLPEFKSLIDLKEFIKDIDTPTLEYMARGLGLKWTPTYHASIHRMRIALAFQQHFFPENFKPAQDKKKSKYGDYSTEDLEKLAKEHKIKVDKTGNDPIDRMKLIMALKAGGHLPN